MKLFRRHFDWSICFGLGWSISSVYALKLELQIYFKKQYPLSLVKIYSLQIL